MLLLNPVGFFIWQGSIWSYGNVFVPIRYQLQNGKSAGLALEHFYIGSGGQFMRTWWMHTASPPITSRTYTSGAQWYRSSEAPGPRALPQWTLDLKAYSYTCRQTKENIFICILYIHIYTYIYIYIQFIFVWFYFDFICTFIPIYIVDLYRYIYIHIYVFDIYLFISILFIQSSLVVNIYTLVHV